MQFRRDLRGQSRNWKGVEKGEGTARECNRVIFSGFSHSSAPRLLGQWNKGVEISTLNNIMQL